MRRRTGSAPAPRRHRGAARSRAARAALAVCGAPSIVGSGRASPRASALAERRTDRAAATMTQRRVGGQGDGAGGVAGHGAAGGAVRRRVDGAALAVAGVDAGRQRLGASAGRRESDLARRTSVHRLAHRLRPIALLPERAGAVAARTANAGRAAARHARVRDRLRPLVPPVLARQRQPHHRRRTVGGGADRRAAPVQVLHDTGAGALPVGGVALHRSRHGSALALLAATVVLAGLFRVDFGAFTGLGALVAVASEPGPWRVRLRRSARLVGLGVLFVTAVGSLVDGARRARRLSGGHPARRAGPRVGDVAALPALRREHAAAGAGQRGLPALRLLLGAAGGDGAGGVVARRLPRRAANGAGW